MAEKRFWLVERVYGKQHENLEITSNGETKYVENILHKDIHPGQFVVLEGDIVMEVVSEAKVLKR